MDGRAQASVLVLMLEENFAVSGEVGLFQGGGGEGRFGVKKARELGDECFSLKRSRAKMVSWKGGYNR